MTTLISPPTLSRLFCPSLDNHLPLDDDITGWPIPTTTRFNGVHSSPKNRISPKVVYQNCQLLQTGLHSIVYIQTLSEAHKHGLGGPTPVCMTRHWPPPTLHCINGTLSNDTYILLYPYSPNLEESLSEANRTPDQAILIAIRAPCHLVTFQDHLAAPTALGTRHEPHSTTTVTSFPKIHHRQIL